MSSTQWVFKNACEKQTLFFQYIYIQLYLSSSSFSDQGTMQTIIFKNKVQPVSNKIGYKHSLNFQRYINPMDLPQGGS